MSEVVIVTGAAGGLGRVYCRALAAAGYGVVAADLDDPAEVVEELGETCLGVQVDVTDRASTVRLAEAALARFGRIDGLVNNADYYTAIIKRPFEEITDEEWARCFDVNVRGTWLCSSAVVPAMKSAGRGKIVNISSMTVPTAPPGFAHYIASKSAIVGLTRALARELGPHGITVNAVAPGLTETEGVLASKHAEAFDFVQMLQAIPRRADAADIAPAVAFLASEEAGWVTGQLIVADGGHTHN